MENGLSKAGLNTNSYISVGLAVLLIGSALYLRDGQKDVAFEVKTVQTRIDVLEKAKISDRWSGTDMFKWAVKLQRDNPALKVPEPKHEEE
jgi:hypothetical protein